MREMSRSRLRVNKFWSSLRESKVGEGGVWSKSLALASEPNALLAVSVRDMPSSSVWCGAEPRSRDRLGELYDWNGEAARECKSYSTS